VVAEGDAAIEACQNDAVRRYGAGVYSVESIEHKKWGNTSLGCPKPGEMYAQVVTPGWLIVLSGGGKTLEYHTNANGRQVVLCDER
jgi:hypothetical protein